MQVHVMRDHPAHAAVMMGGMWGARVDATRAKFRRAFTKLFKDRLAYVSRLKGGWDQVALQRYVWPWAKRNTFAHDSYTCKRFSYTHPFPTRRLEGVGNYVGEKPLAKLEKHMDTSLYAKGGLWLRFL